MFLIKILLDFKIELYIHTMRRHRIFCSRHVVKIVLQVAGFKGVFIGVYKNNRHILKITLRKVLF